jgi:hypothetical protein
MNSTLLLGDPLVLQPCRFAHRVGARMFGASLDRQLAAGRPPETSPLLAARAQDIVLLSRRRAVARDWEHLLEVARRTQRTRSPAVPIRSAQISAAEPAIRELAQRLTAALPVKARGVAMANLLLTDATGPVYSRHSLVTLGAALNAAIAQLDPAIPLAEGDARLPA